MVVAIEMGERLQAPRECASVERHTHFVATSAEAAGGATVPGFSAFCRCSTV